MIISLIFYKYIKNNKPIMLCFNFNIQKIIIYMHYTYVCL